MWLHMHSDCTRRRGYLDLFNFSAVSLIHAASLYLGTTSYSRSTGYVCTSANANASPPLPSLCQRRGPCRSTGSDRASSARPRAYFPTDVGCVSPDPGAGRRRVPRQRRGPDGSALLPWGFSRCWRNGKAMLSSREPAMPQRLRIPDIVCDV